MANLVPSRPRVFLEVNIGERPAGRLTIELFADKTPKTCENFRQLCTGEHNGLSYAMAPFHRVVDEFMIQGGDIDKGDGTGTLSICGEMEDENLDWRKIDTAGLVCSANRGKDTNGSQFFITLDECPHLNGKHTIFGQLVSGEDTLQRIAKVRVDESDRPVEPVIIARCGELERRKKKIEPAAPPQKNVASSSDTLDRGRRRRSNDSDDEMDNTPEPQDQRRRRNRRQSDNIVDEGIRGRPRLRSSERLSSQAASSPDEDISSVEESPARMHKRKRSPSPSRHVANGEYERRRRSLPNQYNSERFSRDGDRYKPSPRRDDYTNRGSRRHDGYTHRDNDDRYRGSNDRDRRDGDGGRLGGGGHDDYDPPVKFKGRGVMKYKEPGRL